MHINTICIVFSSHIIMTVNCSQKQNKKHSFRYVVVSLQVISVQPYRYERLYQYKLKDYTRRKFICCRDLVIDNTKTALQYFRVYDSSVIIQNRRPKHRFVLTTIEPQTTTYLRVIPCYKTFFWRDSDFDNNAIRQRLFSFSIFESK